MSDSYTITVEPRLTARQAASALMWIRDLTYQQKFNISEALELHIGAQNGTKKQPLSVIRGALNALGFNVTTAEMKQLKKAASMVATDE